MNVGTVELVEQYNIATLVSLEAIVGVVAWKPLVGCRHPVAVLPLNLTVDQAFKLQALIGRNIGKLDLPASAFFRRCGYGQRRVGCQRGSKNIDVCAVIFSSRNALVVIGMSEVSPNIAGAHVGVGAVRRIVQCHCGVGKLGVHHAG